MTTSVVLITETPPVQVIVEPVKTTAVHSYAATLITTGTVFPVNHNLGTLEVFATAFLIADGTTVAFTMVRTSASTATLTFSAPVTANTVRVVVIG